MLEGADAKPASLTGCWGAARKNLDAKEGCVEDVVDLCGCTARAAPRVASLRKHSLIARNATIVPEFALASAEDPGEPTDLGLGLEIEGSQARGRNLLSSQRISLIHEPHL